MLHLLQHKYEKRPSYRATVPHINGRINAGGEWLIEPDGALVRALDSIKRPIAGQSMAADRSRANILQYRHESV